MNNKKLSVTMMMLLSLAGCGGSDRSGSPGTAAGAAAMTSADGAVGSSTTAQDDSQFLMATHQDGLFEIRLSQLALQRSTNERVKVYAQRMIDDHTRLGAEITQLAQSSGVSLPADISADQKTQADQLAALSGDLFDRAYMARNVEVHQNDLVAAKQQARQLQQGSDDQVSQLADNSLPLLEIHLALAREISSLVDPGVFLITLYRAGLAEIRWSELALQKAADSRVKDFAQRMIDEHRQATDRIAKLIQQDGITLPTALSPDQQAATDELSQFVGADFDKTYMDKNVVAHLKAVRLVRLLIADGSSTVIKALALEASPVLVAHLLRAVEVDLQLEPSFLYKAYQTGKAEIQLAHLALTQASNAQVKAFAQQMITEHSAANAEIARLAQQNNLALPAEISPEQLRDFVSLTRRSGADFDREYMDVNVQGHRKAVADAGDQAQNGTDADSKALAGKQLPVLNAHLTRATEVRQQLDTSSPS